MTTASPARRGAAPLLLLLLLLGLALPLAACGKKADPSVPAGEQSTYPRTYPHE